MHTLLVDAVAWDGLASKLVDRYFTDRRRLRDLQAETSACLMLG